MRFEECIFKDVIKYLVRYPDGYEEGMRCPVLFCIHGAGGRGGSYEDFKKHPEMTHSAKMEGFPFITVAPICPKADGTWFDYFETLKDLIRFVISQDFTDPARVYAMGSSMGGYTTWELAMSMPECFAAIVPICGGGMYWNAGRLKNVPVWAFHGRLDTAVLVEESEKMVNAVNKRGGCAKLTIYPENKHDAWNDTFSNPEVYRWMLSHTNENAKALVNEYSGNVKEFG
jgi:predicted peptidase